VEKWTASPIPVIFKKNPERTIGDTILTVTQPGTQGPAHKQARCNRYDLGILLKARTAKSAL
jgi:hypothetical protein